MAGTMAAWTGRLGDAWHTLRAPRQGPRVLVTSIPKSGTHLLKSALSHVPGMRVCPGIVLGKVPVEDQVRRIGRLGPLQVLIGHIVYDPRVADALDDHEVRLVLMMRDPRDVVVSLANYIPREHVNHRFYEHFTRTLTDPGDRLMACIRGLGPEHARDGRAMPDVGTLFRTYLEWTAHRAVHACRFERLVGPHGGGSVAEQVAELRALCEFLGLGLSPADVDGVARATFSRDSLTFRKGAIGDWANHFAPRHRDAFREVAGDLLVELGYERDARW